MTALSVQHVGRRFGGIAALDDVCFDLDEGARHVVFGPNGAGKTTLFRVITGEMAPSRGRIQLFGRDVTRLPVSRRARMGVGRTFQVTNLMAGLTVRENALLACQAGHRRRRRFWAPYGLMGDLRESVDDVLAGGGLQDRADALVKALSHGEQRLLEIALAMACKPRLLLLDEPTAGLSGSSAGRVANRIAGLPSSTTVLLVEHNLDVAFRVSKTATVLDFGQVMDHGPVEVVRANPAVKRLYLGDEWDRGDGKASGGESGANASA